MSPAEHDILRAAEEQHWWYAVLHRLVLKELRARVRPGAAVLDAGCGTGGMLARLGAWQGWGVDVSPAAVEHCHRRGLPNIACASVNRLPFPDASFDAVLSLDVLYHQQVEEQAALREVARVLRPDGVFILNVPALDCLRGAHDDAVCGTRRYTACHVRKRLLGPTLETDMIHYWNAWLFLPLLAWRRWSRRDHAARSDLRPLPGLLNRALALAGHADAQGCRHLRLPFGSSVFAVAHRAAFP